MKRDSKNLLFVTNRLGGGGSERVLTSLANQFAEKGYNVTIIYFLKSNQYYIDSRIKCIYLNSKNRIKRVISLRKAIRNSNAANIIAFEYHVNLQTIAATLGLKCNVIVSERNDPRKKGGKFPVSIIRNFLYCFCDYLVCQTEDAKDYFPSVVKKHTVVILNPISSELLDVYVTERKKTVVNFCRLQKQKNLKLLIDAFLLFQNNHKEYKLEIYGDGPEEESLKAYIIQKDTDNVVSLFPSTNDIHRRVVDASMFVSSSDYEGLSNSMLEAMGIGLPTIATDCPIGGARMVINNGVNGILVPVNDINALVNAMEAIADNVEYSNSLSINSKRIKSTLSMEKIMNQWAKLLKDEPK